MEFITSPNQRRITVHKADKQKGYTKIDPQACKRAMATLGYSAFMLYMYFCLNVTNFQLILSTAALCAETSLTRNTYYAAFNELVNKGYLVCKPGTECLFDFYEDPALRKGAKVPAKKQTESTQKQDTPYRKTGENILNTKKRGRADALTTETGNSAAGTDVRRALPGNMEREYASRVFVDI
jgi:hypothetical protein